jgi:cytochrome c553
VKAGRKIFEEGFPDRKVKACASCHGDKAEGKEKDARPRLAGQYAQYVAAQLRLFRGTPLRAHGGLMKEETKPLSDAEIQAVAAYVQSL